MKVLGTVYQYVNILSLDVVAGGVIGALFFGRVFGVDISAAAMAALGLTIWIIYTADHLRDAWTIRTVASTDRHRFHQKYFRIIAAIVIVVAIADFLLIWYVPRKVLFAGLSLWAIVLVYLIFQRYLKFLKEFFVALLYTAGVLLPSVAVLTLPLEGIHYLLIGKFFITALMNLLLFSLYDYNEDRHQEQHSFVTWFGPGYTRTGILSLGTLNIISGTLLWSVVPRIALIFILMNLSLIAVLLFRKHLLQHNYYRMLGDAVFFIPLLYLV